MHNNQVFKLFPKNEEWGTGDEALDLVLNKCLNETISSLKLDSIFKFLKQANSIKPRAYNPTYSLNIELVTKALLATYDPNTYNDIEYKKLKSCYFQKSVVNFNFQNLNLNIEDLKRIRNYRYENMLDFFLDEQSEIAYNPYFNSEIKNFKYNLTIKAIFKDLIKYLSGEIEHYKSDEFLNVLRKNEIIRVEHLGEFWFYQDQIFSIPFTE